MRLGGAEKLMKLFAFIRPGPCGRRSGRYPGKPKAQFRYVVLAALLLLAGWPLPMRAQSPGHSKSDLRYPLCPMLEAVAQANALPLEVFVRMIWRESHLRSDVVGPITRDGERAQGIAQFMPGTAAEQKLLDPFNAEKALPKSGEFLAELRGEFGNLGLAVAAYNAGPERVRRFLAGLQSLPDETRRYVLAVTGQPVEDWVSPTQEALAAQGSQGAKTSCDTLVSHLRAMSARATAFPDRNVPSWCRDLHRPNTAVCGTVHAIGTPMAVRTRLDQRFGSRLLTSLAR